MHLATLDHNLLATLTQSYERDHCQFVTLPKTILDLSSARMALAEMRNEGYVEEQVRGVIRFTARGYEVFKS